MNQILFIAFAASNFGQCATSYPKYRQDIYVKKKGVVDCVLKCDGTRAETTFRLSAKLTSPLTIIVVL